MNTPIRRLTCTTIILGLALSAFAQGNGKAPVALRATVGDVTDNRTTGSFNAECKVELKFTGDAAADAGSVRQVRVTRAEDELGRDLIPKGDEEDSFSSMNSGRRSGALKADVKLRNPSRHAAVIKVIAGEVELFNPTPANGGVLVVKDILKHPAEPVQDAMLKKYGVELMYLTKESYEAKKKQLDAQQKKDGGPLGEAFGEMFSGMFGGMMSSDSKNNLKLYIKDPDKRVVEVEFQDATGKALKRRSSWTSGGMRSMDFDVAPPADAQLKVLLATPEATQRLPFKVENIPLP